MNHESRNEEVKPIAVKGQSHIEIGSVIFGALVQRTEVRELSDIYGNLGQYSRRGSRVESRHTSQGVLGSAIPLQVHCPF